MRHAVGNFMHFNSNAGIWEKEATNIRHKRLTDLRTEHRANPFFVQDPF